MSENELVYRDLDAVKSNFKLDKKDGNLDITSAFIRFGDVTQLDSYMEFFDETTDYSLVIPTKLSMYVDHGYNSLFGTTKINIASLTFGEDEISKGIFMKASMDLSNAGANFLAEKIDEGALGISSGACSHLVRYKFIEEGNDFGWKILNWAIGEGSYTSRPADKRNIVTATSKAEKDKVYSFSQKQDFVTSGQKEETDKKNSATNNKIDYTKGDLYVKSLQELLRNK